MAQDALIAKRYAKGLAEFAADAGSMDAVRRDVRTVARLLDPKAGAGYVPELANYLNSPLASPEDKQKNVLPMLEKAGVGKTVADFVGVLIERGRIDLLPKIAAAFGPAAGDLTGERTATVQTARPLTPDQERRLRAALEAASGGVVHIHQQIEPGLLAGAKVVLGDRTFDGTVLGKLEAVRRRLTGGLLFATADDEQEKDLV